MEARFSPAKQHETYALPAEIGGEDKEPGDIIATSDFAAQVAVEVTVANTTVGTEDGLANLVNNHGHHHKANEQKACENCNFYGGPLSDRRRFVGRVH